MHSEVFGCLAFFYNMTGILGNILPFEGVGHGLGQDQIITRERSSYEMEGLIPFFINV
jgi:hypothetical protein